MNVAERPAKTKLRQTVSGLFYCLGLNGTPLIGIHWPTKAQLAGESNLSPVAGEWKHGETAVAAMIRQVKAEYGLKLRIEIKPILHRPFISEVNRKQYQWMLVHMLPSSFGVQPQPADVASFGWYGPAQLQSGIDLMHQQKQIWFTEALQLAIKMEPNLLPFRKEFG